MTRWAFCSPHLAEKVSHSLRWICFLFSKSTQVLPLLCMGTDVQWLQGTSSWRVPQLALSLCMVRSLELQFGFPFPWCSIIQSPNFDLLAMFSHISECSLWRLGDVLSQSCQSLWAGTLRHSHNFALPAFWGDFPFNYCQIQFYTFSFFV